MTNQTKIKVRVDALIEAIEAKRAEAEIKLAASIARYFDAELLWISGARAGLEAFAEATLVWGGDPSKKVPQWAIPARPYHQVVDLARFNRDIGALQICADETIVISAEDFGRYLA